MRTKESRTMPTPNAPPGVRWLWMLLALMVWSLPGSTQQIPTATVINPQSKIAGTANTPEWISTKNTPKIYTINGACLNADAVTVMVTGPGGYTLTQNAVVKHNTWEYQWLLTSNGTNGAPLGTVLPPGSYTITVTPYSDGAPPPLGGGVVPTPGTTVPATPITVNLTDGVTGMTHHALGALMLLPSTVVSNLFIGNTVTGATPGGQVSIATQIRAVGNGTPINQISLSDPSGISTPVDVITPNLNNINDDNNSHPVANSQMMGIPLTYTLGSKSPGTGLFEGYATIQLQLNDDPTFVFQRTALVDLTPPQCLPTNTSPAINIGFVNASTGTQVVLSGKVQDLSQTGVTDVSGIGSVDVVLSGGGKSHTYVADLLYGPTAGDAVTWNLALPSASAPPGPYIVALVVRDNAGNKTQSSGVAVNIGDPNASLTVTAFTVATPTNLLNPAVHPVSGAPFVGGGITGTTDPANVPVNIAATITGAAKAAVNWTLLDGSTVLKSGTDTGDTGTVNIAYTWDTAVGDESDHTLTIKAIDAQGKTVTQSGVVHVDNKRPVVALNAVPPFVHGSVNLTGTVTDRNPNTAASPAYSWQITIKGTDANTNSFTKTIKNTDIGGSPTDVVYSWDTTLASGGITPADGKYSITLTATDLNGNTSNPNAALNVTLENVKPAPTFTSPVAGNLYGPANSPLAITGSLGLNTSLNDTGAKVAVTIDGGTTNLTQPTANSAANTFTGGNYTLTTGEEKLHQARVRVTNSAGGYGDSTISFSVDTLAPRVVLTAPSNGSPVSGKVVITGVVTDANPKDWTLVIKGVDPGNTSVKTIKFSSNDPAATGSSSTAVVYVWDSVGLGAIDGHYSITLTGTDQVGNTTATGATVTVALSNNAPKPKFTSPVAGTLYGLSNSPLPISGSLGLPVAESTATVAYTLDGNSISGGPVSISPNGTTGAATTFSGTYTLPNGQESVHTLIATVTNAAGVAGSGSVTFSVDTLAPRVTLTTPSNNQAVSGKVMITGVVTDANPKDWTLVIKGLDSTNNTQVQTIKFSDNNPAATGSSSTNVIYVWDAAGLGAKPGHFSITLTGTDQAGNTTPSTMASSVTVLFEQEPTPSFTNPLQNKLYGKTPSSLPVTGSIGLGTNVVDPNAKLSVFLDGTDATTALGIKPAPTVGTATNFSGNYILTIGEEKQHQLRVQVTNSAGLSGQSMVTFNVDTLAPRINILTAGSVLPTLLANGSYMFTVSGSVQDANPSTAMLTVTGPQLTTSFSLPVNGVTTTTFTQPVTLPTGSGNQVYTLTLTATDAAGNTSTTTSTVSILLSPTATLTLATGVDANGNKAPNLTASTTGNPVITDQIYVGTSFVTAANQRSSDVLTATFTNQTNWLLFDVPTLLDDTFVSGGGTASSAGWTKSLPLPALNLVDGLHDFILRAFNAGVVTDPLSSLSGIDPHYYTQVELRNVIVDTTAPTVSILSPAPNQTVFPGSTLTVYFQIDNTTGVKANNAPLLLENGQTPQLTMTIGSQSYDLYNAVSGTGAASNGTATISGSKQTGYTVTWKIPLAAAMFPISANGYTITIGGVSDVVNNTASPATVNFKIGF